MVFPSSSLLADDDESNVDFEEQSVTGGVFATSSQTNSTSEQVCTQHHD